MNNKYACESAIDDHRSLKKKWESLMASSSLEEIQLINTIIFNLMAELFCSRVEAINVYMEGGINNA